MAGSRWQIIVGAVILLVMLLVGTFSLGVYVGEHGWTREGLNYRPAAGQQLGPAPGAGPGPGPGQGRDAPDLIGRIRLLTGSRLELATQQGPRLVELTTDVQVEGEGGEPLQLPELKRGDIVAVFGEFVPGNGGRLVARRIVRISQSLAPTD